MKRSKIITALAITGLFLSGCGDSDDQAAEPEIGQELEQEISTAQEETEAPEQGDKTEEHIISIDDYHATLDQLGNPLSARTRFDIGTGACTAMRTERTVSDEPNPDEIRLPEFLDEIGHSDLEAGTTYVGIQLAREGVDDPRTREVTRAAIEHLCPQMKDKMTDEAWDHFMFWEDN